MAIDLEVARILTIVGQLSEGKILTLPSGMQIAMAEDLTIGPLITMPDSDDPERLWVSTFSELTLRELNSVLTQEGVKGVIP